MYNSWTYFRHAYNSDMHINAFFISNPFIINTLRLNFCNLKIILILHPHYHPKIIGHILKNKQNNKYVCIHTINHNENEDDNEKYITQIRYK